MKSYLLQFRQNGLATPKYETTRPIAVFNANRLKEGEGETTEVKEWDSQGMSSSAGRIRIRIQFSNPNPEVTNPNPNPNLGFDLESNLLESES
jgi:hypothetical protein